MWQRNTAAAFVIVAIILNLSFHWHFVILILDNSTTTDYNYAGDVPQHHATAVANNSSSSSWTPLPWSLPRIDIDDIFQRDLSIQHQSSVEFMLELETIKRKRHGTSHSNIMSLPWKNTIRNTNSNNSSLSSSILLSLPIISLNLPKTGTTSLYDYFHCGGYISTHTHAQSNSNGKSVRLGDCILNNFLLPLDGSNNHSRHHSSRPPFYGCNVTNKLRNKQQQQQQQEIQFYSDIGTVEPYCFYSTLHVGGLEHIVQYYPNATIIMLHRQFNNWYNSIVKWGRGRILERWRKSCGFTTTMKQNSNGSDNTNNSSSNTRREMWQQFYYAHTYKIRQFVINNPSLTYIEVDLNDNTGNVLESYTGISSNCFKKCIPGNGTMKDPNEKCKPV